MNVDELMIGDWVYRVDFKEPIPVRILGLEVVNYDTHPMQYVADVFCPKHNNNVGLYMDEICPIPLTAEILKKNGFEKVNGEYQDVFYCCDGLDLLIDDRLEPWCYTLYGVLELPIRYVHILQHAMRLAGIEKTIEL